MSSRTTSARTSSGRDGRRPRIHNGDGGFGGREILVALSAGELDEPQAAPVDEHVFACDMCAAVTEGLARIVGMLREKLPFAISHAHRDRLVAAGARIRVTLLEATRDRSATSDFS